MLKWRWSMDIVFLLLLLLVFFSFYNYVDDLMKTFFFFGSIMDFWIINFFYSSKSINCEFLTSGQMMMKTIWFIWIFFLVVNSRSYFFCFVYLLSFTSPGSSLIHWSVIIIIRSIDKQSNEHTHTYLDWKKMNNDHSS